MMLHFRSLAWFLLCACCFLSFFSSCQSGPDDATRAEGMCAVTFSVTNYRQISFDDLSVPAASRAETVSMTLANMSVTIFDAESGERVLPTVLHKSNDYLDDPLAFSQFSFDLPFGRYRVLVLGYNGSRECNIASLGHISWADDYVPNTFLYQEEFTVGEGTSLSKDVKLKRVVAAFRLTAEDAIPAELEKMRFASTVGGTVLNGLTGFATENSGRTSEITVPSGYAGNAGVDFTVYLFLPSEQVDGSYTVQAIGQDNAVLFGKNFGDVSLRINYLTTWKGSFFDEDNGETPRFPNGLNISWDMDWAGEISLP